jgi:hypothetical protein
MPDDILNKVISFISRDGEPASDKDMLLRQVAKEISQNKYAKFYRPKQAEADASLGQFFFSVYRIVYPIQVFLKDPAREERIRRIALEAFLDKRTMDLIRRLGPESIAERRKNEGNNLSNTLEEDISVLHTGFDSPKIATADKCYNLIAAMKQFVFFNFCSLLKKFDPEMKEGDFLSQPKFAPVDINILQPDLATFYSVMPPFEAENDWKTVFEILKYCKGGTDIIPPAQWNTLLTSLNDLKQSKILEFIGRLATGNPILEYKSMIPHETLSATWLEQKTSQVRRLIAGIADSQKNAQISTIEQTVFGNLSTIKLSYYNPERGKLLLDKGLDGYFYAPALNHLIVFIEETINKEIQELCELLLIRGKWTNNAASRLMSDSFHTIIEMESEINKLDEELSEEGSSGPRLRGALLRVDRDKTQARYLNSMIDGINEEALNIINRAVNLLIILGKHFKMLLDDCEKKPFELIMNWKELGGMSKAPLSQRLGAAYKKINFFVQLMSLEVRPVEE